MVLKGVISFPQVFEPKVAKGANEAKFSLTMLFPPNDPQLGQVQQEVNTAMADGFPNGMQPHQHVCWQPYDTKYAGKDYYDSRFSGWWALSCTASASDPPIVVDQNVKPLIDRSKVYSGAIVNLHCGITAYTKGVGGIGGWLNGIQITGEECHLGRLDNKPTAEQMFSNAGAAPAPVAPIPAAPAPAPAPPVPAPPAAPAPAPPAPPAAPAGPQMTPAAQGVPYQSYIAQGWTDEQLIANGLMLPPGGAKLAFQQ